MDSSRGIMKKYLTYDDVQIVPRYSDIEHRNDCNTITRVTKNVHLEIPLVSSPMDTVTGLEMCRAMDGLGGMGFLHRFQSPEDTAHQIALFRHQSAQGTIGATIGVTGDYIKLTQMYVDNGAQVILIDVAHGHHKLVKRAIRSIKDEVKGTFDLLVGNIATAEATRDLCEWGADGIRIGVGGGSLCSTRIQTGVGLPMVSSIRDCVSVADGYDVPCMADGGVRSPGDVCKGLGAGADIVMLGSLLSGTKESPGDITKTGQWPNEILQKKYRGSASLESKQDRGEEKNVEGYSTTIPYKGKVKRIVNDIMDGVRSSMSYVGAKNISEYQAKCDFVTVTSNGVSEAKPHLLTR
jgi:IMP dehydrogenase